MKFILTKEKAKDLKEQLEVNQSGGSDFEVAKNTDTFQAELDAALTTEKVTND